MRRKNTRRVCRCLADGKVTYLEAQLLCTLINREIHPIRCASTCARKAQKGLLLGDLCSETHHPMWALKIWKFTLTQIHSKDYDDWIDVRFNTAYVQLRDVISDGICEIIGKRIDDVERNLGLSNAQGRDSWEYWAGDGWYNSLFYEKYDSDWESIRSSYIEMRNDAIESQRAERLFYDAQNVHPPRSRNFFDYWNDYNPVQQEDFYFKIDDWD